MWPFNRRVETREETVGIHRLHLGADQRPGGRHDATGVRHGGD